MKTIYKYSIKDNLHFIKLEVPVGAKFLTVRMQHDTVTVWAMVDPEAPMETRYLELIMTGQEFNADLYEYLGTVQKPAWFGEVVGHMFVLKNTGV